MSDFAALGLQPSSLTKLLKAGFRNTEDVKGITAKELGTETGLSMREAVAVLKELNQHNQTVEAKLTQTAFDLLQTQKIQNPITTQVPELDRILGGGIQVGEVTEICAEPGMGKTQFGMQVALSVQLPKESGGLLGQAVYIDTEGSFMVQRVATMARAFVESIHVMKNSKSMVTMQSFLERIHYFRVHDYQEQCETIKSLGNFLKVHEQVRVVIIDSMAFHFRHEFEDMSSRSRLLSSLSSDLHELAANFAVAIVVMNHITTKVVPQQSATTVTSHLVPALGASWSHAVTSRIMLYWKGACRCAHLVKSPSQQEESVLFQVTDDGVRGVNLRKRGPCFP